MEKKSKDYYRTEINRYLDKVDRSELLREVGIDKSNFSSFLSGRQTLSNKKLQSILDAMIVSSNPNNKERMFALDVVECAREIKETFLDNPCKEYLDIEKWLQSKDKRPAYKGTDAKYLKGTGFNNPCDCVVVGDDKKHHGNVLIIVRGDESNKDKLESVNKDKIINNDELESFINSVLKDRK